MTATAEANFEFGTLAPVRGDHTYRLDRSITAAAQTGGVDVRPGLICASCIDRRARCGRGFGNGGLTCFHLRGQSPEKM
ncbi:hypothetical protein V1291_000230 [Nitrobacteraceae bacterium AZCC 1564]